MTTTLRAVPEAHEMLLFQTVVLHGLAVRRTVVGNLELDATPEEVIAGIVKVEDFFMRVQRLPAGAAAYDYAGEALARLRFLKRRAIRQVVDHAARNTCAA